MFGLTKCCLLLYVLSTYVNLFKQCLIGECLSHTFRYFLGAVGIALPLSMSVVSMAPNSDAHSSFSEGVHSNKQTQTEPFRLQGYSLWNAVNIINLYLPLSKLKHLFYSRHIKTEYVNGSSSCNSDKECRSMGSWWMLWDNPNIMISLISCILHLSQGKKEHQRKTLKKMYSIHQTFRS